MRIAAVVVTHNRPQLLKQVLAALRGQTRVPDRVVVVDNASDEPTRTLLAQSAGLTVLRSDTNLGGAGGFALGIEHACAAGFDWIWLMDDDAIPRPDALAWLEQAVDGAPLATGAVCGAVREFGDIAMVHRRYYGERSAIERVLPRQAYRKQAVPVDTASFVGFMVAAQAVEHVGLPERDFFLAYDDTEYSLRLRRAGWAIWMVPTSIIDHMRATRGRLRSGPFGRKHYFNVRNRIVVARRYASLPALAAGAAALYGALLWLGSAGRFRPGAFRIFLRAIADGMACRLGGYPADLARLEADAAVSHGLPARSGKTP
jgi:GT2 family glycosyltransferase